MSAHVAATTPRSPSEDKIPSLRDTLAYLWPYFWPTHELGTKIRFSVSWFLLFLGRCLALIIPFFFRAATNDLQQHALLPSAVIVPLALIVGYGSMRIVVTFVNEAKEYLFAHVEHRAIYHVSRDIFRHVHKLSLQFHLGRKTGMVTRVIERGTQGIERSLRFITFVILPALLEGAFLVILLWVLYGVEFAVISGLTLSAYVGTTVMISNWRIRYLTRMNTADDDRNTRVIDSLLNYETVKYYVNETLEEDRHAQAAQRYAKAALVSKASLGWLNLSQTIIIALGLTGILWLAALGIQAGTLTVGDFVMMNIFMLQVYIPLANLGFAFREVKQSVVNIGTMVALMNESPTVPDTPTAQPLKPGPGAIAFHNVSFRYMPDRPILANISFQVPAGTTVAIVGPSGSGKSTIARLLCRFYDLDEGYITIDGQNIADVTQTSVRQVVGVVPQDTVLFNDTLRYNILYGRPSASMDEVKAAASMAQLKDFIERLPEGYETLVGERGLKLSGGEKQRVAIARTLLKNPEIYLFDEATSSLDTKTEKDIQQSLNTISQGKTTLIIAHRLSTIVHADTILVLVHGKIVEQGNHSTLLAAKGVYAAMWNHQQRDATA